MDLHVVGGSRKLRRRKLDLECDRGESCESPGIAEKQDMPPGGKTGGRSRRVVFTDHPGCNTSDDPKPQHDERQEEEVKVPPAEITPSAAQNPRTKRCDWRIAGPEGVARKRPDFVKWVFSE